MKQENNLENNMILIDVRDKEEWDANHDPQAVHIPLPVLKKEILACVPKKDAAISLCCRSGRRAREGQTLLQALGYSEVTVAEHPPTTYFV